MVEPRTSAENVFIKQTFPGVWIGVSYDHSVEEWQWGRDKTKVNVDSEFWRPGEPNNHQNIEFCASLKQGYGWFDSNCDHKNPFVCQVILDGK